jgi:predicted nucleic acid-binding protein
VIEAAVVDASVAVKWVVEEQDSGLARTLAQAKLEAPDLLYIECANILWKKVRIGDLTRLEAAACLDILLRAPVTLAGSVGILDLALDLSLEWRHPVYDCVYAALAIRRGITLVTADKKLAVALQKYGKRGVRAVFLGELAG